MLENQMLDFVMILACVLSLPERFVFGGKQSRNMPYVDIIAFSIGRLSNNTKPCAVLHLSTYGKNSSDGHGGKF